MDGILGRVLKTADFKHDKKMVAVREGELLAALDLVPKRRASFRTADKEEGLQYSPVCGAAVS